MTNERIEAEKSRRPFRAQPAVRWLEPVELLRAAMRMVLATTFGDYADRREMMAGIPPKDHNECGRMIGESLWLDYVADTGDGFDATFAVAEAIAAEGLPIDPVAGPLLRPRSGSGPSTAATPLLPRGRVLVMGGDQVYPSASPEAYWDRTLGPYEAALPWVLGEDDRAPDQPAAYDQRRNGGELSVYALPGNHDWYDGLSAFQKAFCTNQWMGAWKTQQTRSSFAVRLRDNCWLWGIDVALGDHLDRPQVSYFRRMSLRLKPGDSVILCLAKPYWDKPQRPADDGSPPSNASADAVGWLQRSLIVSRGATVPLILSGDHHHYARRTANTSAGWEQHLIVAGGGGAYLSSTAEIAESVDVPDPTIDPSEDEPTMAAPLATTTPWPSAREATRLAWRKAWWRIGTCWRWR